MSTPRYHCHVIGRDVQPLSVGDLQTVQGYRYAWWHCPSCDCDEHVRSEVGFDARCPGVHIVWFDTPPPLPREWRSRFSRLEATR